MAMTDAAFIEKCIPDSLRLAKHQDAELVNSAIATALLAYRKALRDNVWEKNICSDVAMALSGFMEGTYTPHISQENEDWSKLQLEAEEARVMKASAAELAASSVPSLAVSDYERESKSFAYMSLTKDGKPSGGISVTYWGRGDNTGYKGQAVINGVTYDAKPITMDNPFFPTGVEAANAAAMAIPEMSVTIPEDIESRLRADFPSSGPSKVE